jgi:hypothetical protein
MTPDQLGLLEQRLSNARAAQRKIDNAKVALEMIDKVKPEKIADAAATTTILMPPMFPPETLIASVAREHAAEFLDKVKTSLKACLENAEQLLKNC